MAQYITTGEDLTSIADAIRAKTGDSASIIYPTGFITEIGKLASGDWLFMGKDAQLVWESSDINHTLSETSLSTWTPSTTSILLYDSEKVTSSLLYLDATKRYVVIYESYYKLAYNSTPSVAHQDLGYFIGMYYFCSRPNTFNSFINKTNDWVTYAAATNMFYSIYYTNSGNKSVTNNTYGIYFNNTYPRLASLGLSNFGCNLYTPSLRAGSSSTYMADDAFGALNLSNSTFHTTVKLYSASDNIMSNINDRIRELYDINNNITT